MFPAEEKQRGILIGASCVMEERITSRKNPLLQQVKKLLSSRKDREEAGLYVSDGTKLLEEAAKYAQLDTVILSEGVDAKVPENVRVIRVPGDVMESISPHAQPSGGAVPVPPAGKDRIRAEKGHGAAGRHSGSR